MRQLLADGHTVTALDVQFTPSRLPPPSETFAPRRGDVAELGDVLSAAVETRAQRIIHLGYVLRTGSERQPRLGLRVNTLGAEQRAGDRAAYSDWNGWCTPARSPSTGTRPISGNVPVTEDDDCLPMNLYGMAKRLNDMTAQRYAELYGLDVVGLRIATVFGYGRETGNSAWVGKIASYPAVERPVRCPLPSWQKSAMIYVDDVAAMLVRLCLAPGSAPHVPQRGRHVQPGGARRSGPRAVPSSDITFDDAAPDFPHVYLVDDRRLRSRNRLPAPVVAVARTRPDEYGPRGGRARAIECVIAQSA